MAPVNNQHTLNSADSHATINKSWPYSLQRVFFNPHLSSYNVMRVLFLKDTTTLEKQHNRLFLLQTSYRKCQTSAILRRHKDKTAVNAAGTEGSWYLIFVLCGFDWLPAITGEIMETDNAFPLELSTIFRCVFLILKKFRNQVH